MKHVFVETNWVVEYAAPAHVRTPAALELAEKAAAGDIRLHVPSVCLTEARQPIRMKFHPRSHADSIRVYVKWATTKEILSAEERSIVLSVLDQFESSVTAELENVEERLQLLRRHSGIEVFALSDDMLVRTADLSAENLHLEPFDQAILAAVLVRAKHLRASGAEDVCFCELDRDLQPWDKHGNARKPLVDLYDSAGVWVYGDFTMENPARRPSFPEKG